MTPATETLDDFPAVLNEEEQGAILALPDNEPELVALGDRLLRDLQDTRAEKDANDAACKVEVERLKKRFVDLNSPLERKEARLLHMLEQCARALPLRGKKSRDLAFGRIGWRTHKPRLDVQDDAALMEWVKQQSLDLTASLLRKKITESIDKKALDAHCLKTGDLPNGCTLVPAVDQFYAAPGNSAPDTE
jgi:phage host-nuclease inhibitor protein Gam